MDGDGNSPVPSIAPSNSAIPRRASIMSGEGYRAPAMSPEQSMQSRYENYGYDVTHPVVGSGGSPPTSGPQSQPVPEGARIVGNEVLGTRGEVLGISTGGGRYTPGLAVQMQAAPIQSVVETEAMTGFTALQGGFEDVFTVGFVAGRQARNVATGQGLKPTSEVMASEQDIGIGGISAGQFKGEASAVATYIFPGGAVLHGIGDVNESAQARAFDIGVGALPFIPGVGAAGAAAKGVTGFALRGGVGAGISAAGTYLQGGSPTQVAEAALVGGVIGGAAPYAIRGVQSVGEKVFFTSETVPDVRFQGNLEDITPGGAEGVKAGPVARGVTPLETTESGRIIQPAATKGGIPGASYGSKFESETQYLSRTVPKETYIQEPNPVGESTLERGLLAEQASKATAHVNEQVASANAADALANRSTMEAASEAYGTHQVKVSRFGPVSERLAGLKDYFSAKSYGQEPVPSQEYGKVDTSGFGQGQGREANFMEKYQRGPAGQGTSEPSTSGAVSEFYERTGEKTAFAVNAEETGTGAGKGTAGFVFTPTPPSYGRPSSNFESRPVNSTVDKITSKPGQSPTTMTKVGTTPTGSGGLQQVFTRPKVGPSYTPGTDVFTTPSSSTTTTPKFTPQQVTTPQTRQELTPTPGFAQNFAFAREESKPARTSGELKTPFGASPFSHPSPTGRAGQSFGFRELKHPLGNLFDIGKRRSKRK